MLQGRGEGNVSNTDSLCNFLPEIKENVTTTTEAICAEVNPSGCFAGMRYLVKERKQTYEFKTQSLKNSI